MQLWERLCLPAESCLCWEVSSDLLEMPPSPCSSPGSQSTRQPWALDGWTWLGRFPVPSSINSYPSAFLFLLENVSH